MYFAYIDIVDILLQNYQLFILLVYFSKCVYTINHKTLILQFYETVFTAFP